MPIGEASRCLTAEPDQKSHRYGRCSHYTQDHPVGHSLLCRRLVVYSSELQRVRIVTLMMLQLLPLLALLHTASAAVPADEIDGSLLPGYARSFPQNTRQNTPQSLENAAHLVKRPFKDDLCVFLGLRMRPRPPSRY